MRLFNLMYLKFLLIVSLSVMPSAAYAAYSVSCPSGGSYNGSWNLCTASGSATVYICTGGPNNGAGYGDPTSCSNNCYQTANCTAIEAVTCSIFSQGYGDTYGTPCSSVSISYSCGSCSGETVNFEFDENCNAYATGWSTPNYPDSYWQGFRGAAWTTFGANTSCGASSSCLYVSASDSITGYTCPLGGYACNGSNQCTETWGCSQGGGCPSGYSWNGSVCAANPSCPSGGYASGGTCVCTSPEGGVGFTDPGLTGGTPIRAVHINELRSAINNARADAGLGAYPWTDSIGGGTPIRVVHINDLRTAITQVYQQCGWSAPGFTDSISGGTPIRAVHIQQLRSATVNAP